MVCPDMRDIADTPVEKVTEAWLRLASRIA
jgi:hypothetical protein